MSAARRGGLPRALGLGLWLAFALGGSACGHDLPSVLARAERRFEARRYADARTSFDVVVARARPGTRERVEALTGGARASLALGDTEGARARLEEALHPEVPGVSEPAMFYLAELLRDEDRPRALALYYRAAAGAETHRRRGFPYAEATRRLLQLSMTR